MEYVINVKTKEYGWCLHCLAGRIKEEAERRLAEEQAKHPELDLQLQELSQEESADCWWNKWGTN